MTVIKRQEKVLLWQFRLKQMNDRKEALDLEGPKLEREVEARLRACFE